MSWLVSIVVAGLMATSAEDFKMWNARPNSAPVQTVQAAANMQIVSNEKIDQTFPLNPNGRISLNNLNGAVIIEAVDRADVRVEAVKTIDCEKPFDINIKIDATTDFLRIETEYPKNENTVIQSGSKDSKGWSYGYGNRCRAAKVDYKLTVPRSARLDRIETVNGGITLAGTTEFVKASTVNGKISASQMRGSINLSTVNGTLDIDFEDLTNVRDVTLGMVNGSINLQFPSDIDAIVKADTVNGRIVNDFGLPVVRGEYVGRNLYGKLGAGGIPVKLSGVNGTINVRRKQDGRTAKPAVNLLPNNQNRNQSDDDEMDDDNDDSESAPANPPRPPRPPRAPGVGDENAEGIVGITDEINRTTSVEVRRALKNSAKAQREAAKALRDAKIDSAEIRRQVAEGLAEARQELAKEGFDFDFNFDFAAKNNSLLNPMGERETKTLAVEGVPNVVVNARGGAVSIRGWDKPEISYALLKNSADLKVDFVRTNQDINLTVTGDSQYRLEIYVPRLSNLRVSTDRQLRVENVKGNLQLDAQNDQVDVRDAAGKLDVRAANGKVRVIGFDGETRIKTANGDIALEGDFSTLDTATASGATFLTLRENQTAQIETGTLNISFDGIAAVSETADGMAKTNVWRIGDRNATAPKYSLKSAAGQIFVSSQTRVRASRDYAICNQEVFIE